MLNKAPDHPCSMPKRLRFAMGVTLVYIRRSAAYPLSYRHHEEMMQKRGLFVDHANAHRWTWNGSPIFYGHKKSDDF